jgi:hypothetical protein
MTGTAWQCIFCGEAAIEPAAADVPEPLAKLLEEEYKRVVWQMIYPGGDSVSRSPPSVSGRTETPPALLQEVHSIARKRLRTGDGMYRGVVSATWALFLAVAAVFLVLLLLPKESHHRRFAAIAILFALACISIAVISLCATLVLADLRRRRLIRVDERMAVARSPKLKIQPGPTAQTNAGGIQAEAPGVESSQMATPKPG